MSVAENDMNGVQPKRGSEEAGRLYNKGGG